MPELTIRFRFEVGRARAEWCDNCALPSAVAADVLMLTPRGVDRVGTWVGCRDCGEVQRGNR